MPVEVETKIKQQEDNTCLAFLKTGPVESLIRVGLDKILQKDAQSNEVIKIKLEIDINLPFQFLTEIHYLMKPIPFS